MIQIKEIENYIYIVRGEKVILDENLASLYGITTTRLNEQVSRNIERFPEDFMFQLTRKEYKSLRSQIAILKKGRGKHRKFLPRAFTEHGIAMLSSVLRTHKAVQVNISIMRIFIKLRKVLASHEYIISALNEIRGKTNIHDKQIKLIFDAFRELTQPPLKPKNPIGFSPKK
ncbi:ORF6N domain-containing protein [bacterium]|nr:ORF6N domain-containing protein [bacterium]